jgi:hypothetical protein
MKRMDEQRMQRIEREYGLFKDALRENDAAKRVCDRFIIPRVQFGKVYRFADAFARGDVFDRKAYLKDLAADLRHEQRRLEAELASCSAVWRPGESGTLEDYLSSGAFSAASEKSRMNRRKYDQLADVRRKLENIPLAANVKRAGIGGDMRWLFCIRQYLQAKTGLLLSNDDLAAIVNAAYSVLDAELSATPTSWFPNSSPRHGSSPAKKARILTGAELSRKLKRFENNPKNRVFCDLARDEGRCLAEKSL